MGAVHSLDLASCLIVERQKLRCYNGGMTISIASLSTITDAKLLTAVTQAAAQERTTTAHLIALLAELDSRRLYLGEGCSSLFTYCTQVLRLSEHAAYRRIEAARCARRFPVILDQLTEGAITLTTIGVLAPHLTSENVQEVLTAARHKTKETHPDGRACVINYSNDFVKRSSIARLPLSWMPRVPVPVKCG